MIAVYNIGLIPPQKASILILYFLFFLWILQYEMPKPIKAVTSVLNLLELVKLIRFYMPSFSTMLYLPIIFTIPNTLYLAWDDIQNPYSYDCAIADYISQELPDNAVVLVSNYHASGLTVGFIPLIKGNQSFYDLHRQQKIEYAWFDNDEYDLSSEEIISAISDSKLNNPLYFLSLDYQSPDTIAENDIRKKYPKLQSFTPSQRAFEPALAIYQVKGGI